MEVAWIAPPAPRASSTPRSLETRPSTPAAACTTTTVRSPSRTPPSRAIRTPTAGGGIGTSGGTLTIRNTTIAANLGNGGLHIDGGAPVLVSCIVAGNVGGDILKGFARRGIHQQPRSKTRPTRAASPTASTPTSSASTPMLSPLSNNGGPTFTMALQVGSPAVNKGLNPANLTTDQRGTGFARLHGTAIDIGAIEFSAIPSLSLPDPLERLHRPRPGPHAHRQFRRRRRRHHHPCRLLPRRQQQRSRRHL
jgi:hypothetical protein